MYKQPGLPGSLYLTPRGYLQAREKKPDGYNQSRIYFPDDVYVSIMMLDGARGKTAGKRTKPH